MILKRYYIDALTAELKLLGLPYRDGSDLIMIVISGNKNIARRARRRAFIVFDDTKVELCYRRHEYIIEYCDPEFSVKHIINTLSRMCTRT